MYAVFTNQPAGPTIMIGVSAPDANPVLIAPPQTTVFVPAVADTGCSGTSICESLAKQAKLPVISKGTVHSASGSNTVDIYFGDLWIGGRVPFGGTFYWRFPGRAFHQLQFETDSYKGLLGMDVFKEGVLVVDGPGGKTTFTW